MYMIGILVVDIFLTVMVSHSEFPRTKEILGNRMGEEMEIADNYTVHTVMVFSMS